MPEISQKLSFDAQQAIANLSRLTASIAGANKSMDKMQSTANEGAKSLAKITDGTKKASKASEEFSVSWKTIVRVLQTQLIVRGLNSVISGLRNAIENARELGLAIEEVRTIDAAGRTAADISEQVLALSDAIGQAPTDLAEGLYQTLSNQVVEAGESFEFMGEAAKLAKVTASETGDAVNALSSVMNSYNLAASEAEHVSGTLFATVEQGRLRLGEIANVIGRVTPLTAQLGITWEETAAAIATMTRQGVRADTAITQLRAVVTRLLKPTAEMSAIFRKWGVDDGRQAILTFGGLTGVLKKLAQETGGSSQEMSILLRNVRAIAGVFGIMSNEGKTMEEVMANITTATTDATEAWTEFAKSDAQRLTAEMQKFDNTLTRIGAETLPSVIGLLEFLNGMMETGGLVIRGVSGNWSLAEQAAKEYARAVREGAKDATASQKAWAKASEGAYDVITEASRLYYAEVNKLEDALAVTRDNAITSATAVLKNATDSLTDLYSDNLKKIEQFAGQAAGNVESSFQRMADLRKEVDDRILERDLEGAKSNVKKLEILDAAYLSSLEKRRDAAAKISADPQTIKDFNAATDVSLGFLDRRLTLAKKMGASLRQQTAYRNVGIKLLKEEHKGEERFALLAKKSELATREGGKAFAETEVRVKAIGDRMDEIHADGVVTPEEHKELDTLFDELDRLNTKAKEAAKTFQDFGLDIDFSLMVDGLTAALNQAHKDWDAELAIANAVFSQAVISLQVSLDPGGALAEFQKQIGQVQLPGQRTAAFATSGDEAAHKMLKDDLATTAKIAMIRDDLRKPMAKTGDIIRKMSQDNSKIAADGLADLKTMRTRFSIAVGIDGVLGKSVATTADEVAKMRELLTVRRGFLTTLQQEGALEDGAIEKAGKKAQTAFAANLITKDQLSILEQIDQQLSGQANRTQKIIDLEKGRRPEAELESADRVLEQKKGIVDQSLTEAQIRKEIANTEAVQKELLDGMQQTTERTSNAAGTTRDNLGAANTQAENITINVTETTKALGGATAQAKELTAELGRGAINAAKISSVSGSSGDGSSQYHGGPHYAAGGPFRGQDRQLTALARGETVVNRKNSSRFFSELNAMNQGSQPVYREQGGTVTNVGDVNVTVKGGDSSQQTVREIGHALRREVKRGNLKFR